MGYSITIGNAEIYNLPEELFAEYRITEVQTPYSCSLITIDNMYCRGSNMRMGYIQYHAMLEKTGLVEVLTNEDLDNEAKALIRVTPEMWQSVGSSIHAHRERYPSSVCLLNEGGLTPNSILARLLWFEYWINWSLKNCKLPGIEFI